MSTIGTTVIAITIASGCLASARIQVAPVSDRPNPYQTLKDWAKLATSAVDIDRDGQSIGVASAAEARRAPHRPAESVAADRAGNAYGAVVPAQMLQKHVRAGGR